MEATVLSPKGESVRTIKLDTDVFGQAVNNDVIYYAITNELANLRLGTACTKDRGEVHGTNRKPYAQKGTGRARQGDFKSPTYVGGGTAFGPKPRDFSFSLPKKVKRLAFKSILSLKYAEGNIAIIEDFTIQSGKTRDLITYLKPFAAFVDLQRTVFVTGAQLDKGLRQAGSNIPWLRYLSFNRLRAHDLLYSKKILIFESAAKELNLFFSKTETSL